jgi:hypothetical protein
VNIKKHFIVLLLGIFFLLPAGRGADIAFSADTTQIKVRLPDARHIAAYRDQKEFNYTRKAGNYSFQSMLQRWLFDKLKWLFRLFDHAGSVELFLVILIALAIIAVILKINNINPIALFRRKNQALQPSYDIGNENIAQMDFPVLIDQSIRQGNYRLAVRYHYLQTLVMLAMAGKIQPRDEKTNRQYVSELGSGETRNVFARLVYGFEFIWYGEFVPDEMQYQRISEAFIEFQKSLAE